MSGPGRHDSSAQFGADGYRYLAGVKPPADQVQARRPTTEYPALASAATPYARVQAGPRPAAPPLQPVPPAALAGLPASAEADAIRPVGYQENKGQPARAGAPLLRLVNTKRITLNFEIKDVGPSGVSGVELWYTQDARDWRKYDAPAQAHAYIVEVDEEGMYGFTLRARSGIGQGKQPPAPGDPPQVWVIVDLTRPDVRLGEVTPSVVVGRPQVVVRWKATDKNLGRSPVSLAWAEKEEGPWHPIAANIENTGSYLWQLPAGGPARFLVRVEAVDLAGNVGRAQTATPVVLDTATPTVSIINVEANIGR